MIFNQCIIYALVYYSRILVYILIVIMRNVIFLVFKYLSDFCLCIFGGTNKLLIVTKIATQIKQTLDYLCIAIFYYETYCLLCCLNNLSKWCVPFFLYPKVRLYKEIIFLRHMKSGLAIVIHCPNINEYDMRIACVEFVVCTLINSIVAPHLIFFLYYVIHVVWSI